MFKKYALFLLVSAALISFVPMGLAQGEDTGMMESEEVMNAGNKICPVSGDKIANPGQFTVEYEGVAYNLCCPACKKAFLGDPEKYIAKVEEELAAQDMSEEAGMDMQMEQGSMEAHMGMGHEGHMHE